MKRSDSLLSLLPVIILCVALSVIIGCGGGSNPESTATTWIKKFGGPSVNEGSGVRQTADGGYIISGQTNSSGAGQYDIYLIRLDAEGNELWSKTFGGPADDDSASVRQTADGGFIIAGQTNSFGAGKYDIYVVRTDAEGNELWSKTFGGPDDDIASSIRQTSDGGFIIAGTTGAIYSSRVRTNVYLIKTDTNGDTVWTKTFDGSSNKSGNSVEQTSDGGFILTGTTFDFNSGHYGTYTAKTDRNGDIQWTRSFEDGSQDVMGIAVQQTNDGGYMVLGKINSGLGFGDAIYFPILIKIDSGGNILWTKTLEEGTGVTSFYRTSDDGFFILGATGTTLNSSIYLIRTDSAGSLLWSKIFTETAGGGTAVQQTSDGGYVIAGGIYPYSNGLSGVLVIKTDGNGEF